MGNEPNNGTAIFLRLYKTLKMNKYTYKKQGDGRDSWRVETPEGEIYMVYEDPTKVETLDEKAIRLSNELNEIINQLKQ